MSDGLIKMIGKKGVLELLNELGTEPKSTRYLEGKVPIGATTLWRRMKELQRLNAIKPILVTKGERTYKGYEITRKGKDLLKMMDNFKKS